MIGVQSYYFSRNLLEWEQKCWELSYNSILKHTSITDIVVYTNAPEKVPFSCNNIKLLPDTYKDQFNKGWWQIYKQFLYQYISEPFVHIDYDLIITNDIVNLNGDIICEKKRGNTRFTGIEVSQGYNQPENLLCSGIMGKSTGHDFFKESFDATLRFINNYDGFIRDSYRWSCEEGIIYEIAKRENLIIQEIGSDNLEHYQGKMWKMSADLEKTINKKYEEYKLWQ